MEKTDWIICPICKSKTRVKIRGDTELIAISDFVYYVGGDAHIAPHVATTAIRADVGISPYSIRFVILL
jgi:hypothetical protein